MCPKITYFEEEGITERDQYWYRKGKSDGFLEGSKLLLDLNCKIEMLKLNPTPIIIMQPVEIISTKKEI